MIACLNLNRLFPTSHRVTEREAVCGFFEYMREQHPFGATGIERRIICVSYLFVST